MKKKTIKVPSRKLLDTLGLLMALYGDKFADWLMENKERLYKDFLNSLSETGECECGNGNTYLVEHKLKCPLSSPTATSDWEERLAELGFIHPPLIQFIRNLLASEREKVIEETWQIFEWLLGERGDFPSRKEGQGAYYWRTELRKKLDELKESK